MIATRARLVAALVAVAWTGACTPPQPGPDGGVPLDDVCFFGDKALVPEGELVFRTEDGAIATLDDGASVPLQFGIQGGHMVLVSARVKNMDLCTLQVNAGVRDTCTPTQRIIGREGRPVTNVDDGSGFGVPKDPQNLDNFANLQLCPNLDATRDIDGHPYGIEVRLLDRARRSLVLTGTLVPTCRSDDLNCLCSCDDNVTLGEDNCANGAPDDTGEPTPGACPAGEGEGEGEGATVAEGEGEGGP